MEECNYVMIVHCIRHVKCIPMTAMRAGKNLGRATRRINPRNVRNPNGEIAIWDLA